MWHQPRRRRLQPKRLQQRSVLQRRRPLRSVLLRRRPLPRRSRRSVLLRRRPLRSVLLRRRPPRSVLLRRRPPRSVLQPRRPPRSVLQPRRLPQRSSQFSFESWNSRGPQGPLECFLGAFKVARFINVEAPPTVGDEMNHEVVALRFKQVKESGVRAVLEVEVDHCRDDEDVRA